MLPRWLRRSSSGLSILFAAITWFVVATVYSNSEKDGIFARTIDTIYVPAYDAGRYVGTFVFPDHSTRGTTGWYVVPLFGIGGEFLLLLVIWYVCIRLKRAFEPEQDAGQTTDYESIEARRRKPISKHFDGEHEPLYAPEQDSGRIFYLINYERFKLDIYRDFHDHTGRWPLLSICFHYGALLGMFVSIAVFFWMRDKQQWDDGRSFAIGISAAIAYLVFVLVGESIMRKLDWRFFGNVANKELAD